MYTYPSDAADLRTMLLAVDDLNERSRLILDYGLMHDPDLSDVVAVAAAGSGEFSTQLSAMIGHPDEPFHQPAQPEPAGTSSSELECLVDEANPFHRVVP